MQILSLTVQNKNLSTQEITVIVEDLLDLRRRYIGCRDEIIGAQAPNEDLTILKEAAIQQIGVRCEMLGVPAHETVAVMNQIINQEVK